MKSTTLIIVLILWVGMLHSQTLTEKYLNKIPALPKDSCNISKVAAENFKQNVSILIDQIKNDIENLKVAENEQSTINEEAVKEHAMQQMSQQYGLSQQQITQMKAGKMSSADKQALANQVLQQQTNMSMSEVQNLSKMSESGRKAYAEALGAEMMATSHGNQNTLSANVSSSNMIQLVQDQQAVMNRINLATRNISNPYSDIENDPNLQKMRKNIDTWHNKMMAMSGIVSDRESKQMDSLAVLIKTTQIKICQNYTPKYMAALRNHYTIIKAMFPDVEKLSEITAQMTKIQTGIEPPKESLEIGNLGNISGYLEKLADAYMYKLYYKEDDNSR